MLIMLWTLTADLYIIMKTNNGNGQILKGYSGLSKYE